MRLRDLFSTDVVVLDVKSETKGDLLKELVAALALDAKSEEKLVQTLKRREKLGSTGIGKGIAIPHCRSLVVSRLHLVYGRKRDGLDFDAIDGKPAHHFFLILAPPPPEVTNQYLPVLGKIAQFAKDPEVPRLLDALETPEEFLELLEERAT